LYRFDGNKFLCGYYDIYAKIEGEKIIPLEDTLFCEKIVEPGIEIACFKVPDKVSDTYAKVFEVSRHVSKQGIQKGDVIFFTKTTS
jgi:hypothetical protein